MVPATVSASYAFMVPVATPPNAFAFSYGYLKVYNMVSNFPIQEGFPEAGKFYFTILCKLLKQKL